MKSYSLSIYPLVATVLLLSCCMRCEQLSTVFVLETSDSSSDSSPSVVEKSSKPIEDTNTRIVTDDGQPSSSNNKQSKQQVDSPTVIVQNLKHPQQQNTHHQTPNQSNNNNQDPGSRAKQQEAASSRRLEDEQANYDKQQQRVNTRSPNQQAASNTVRPKSTIPNDYEAEHSSTPKTEERLLISIVSEDDEYKPSKQLGSSLGSIPSVSSQDQQQQKRKPSITISIQESNIGKQNGGDSPRPAVILRPSENGQSIVISTVGVGSINTNNNRPIVIPTSSNHNTNINEPYREPVENQNHHNHQSSTNRPYLVNEHNPIGSNRPLVSTLIDQPSRPPINDERPIRPVNVPDETNYELNRPSPRPTRPEQDQTSYDENNRPGSQYPLNEKNCGIQHETRIVGGEEADPADFLWMAAIIKSKSTNEVRPFCGGSLITRRHILTAAHCLENLAPRDVLVRLGSYDFDDNTASSVSLDYAIDQFRVPANYSKKTHAADIAIMRLKTPLSTNDNYKTVCMPQARRSYVGQLGTVTGYGSQSQSFRRAAPKLRQVTVPIWENRKCSVVYKKNLTDSFLCAGYEEGGKDACQGDSGGPLMTEGPNERLMVVGVVSHGIGCGSPGYPGVYTRTTTYLDWIEKNTKE